MARELSAENVSALKAQAARMGTMSQAQREETLIRVARAYLNYTPNQGDPHPLAIQLAVQSKDRRHGDGTVISQMEAQIIDHEGKPVGLPARADGSERAVCQLLGRAGWLTITDLKDLAEGGVRPILDQKVDASWVFTIEPPK